MILNSPYITGSITVTGNANIQGQLTVTGSLSGTATSASYAYTASSAINAFSASNAISSSYSATASFSNDFTVLGNLTVFGTQSVQYITSSQLNISDNVITVNVASPGVRFGGLSVFDSGSQSSEATASLFWDSQNNHWVYQRESGSTYNGGMLISGPRNAAGLGNELGTTACMLLVGQGGDHLTSSMIYHDSTATCIPNALNVGGVLSGGSAAISGSGTFGTCMTNGDFTIVSNSKPFLIKGRQTFDRGFLALSWDISPDVGTIIGESLGFNTNAIPGTTGGTRALTLACNGAATFASTVTASSFSSSPLSNAPYLDLTYNSTAGLKITYDASTAIASIDNYYHDTVSSIYYGDIRFRTKKGGVNTLVDALTIKGFSGNVGIGTCTPSGKLDILGSNEVMNISGTNAVSAYTGYYYNTSTLAGYIGNGSSILTGAASSDFIFRSQGALVYAIGNSEKMRITCGGNVGIGTSTPTALLQVSSACGGIISINSTTTNSFRGIVFQNNANSDATEYAYIKYNATSGEFRHYANPAAFGGFTTWYSNNVESMRLNTNGYLFVGCTTNSGFSGAHRIKGPSSTENTDILSIDGGIEYSGFFRAVTGANYTNTGTAIIIGRNTSTGRSINAGGTINASGADYAEYMTKATNITIAKGDIVGVNSEGKLTNIFEDSISFVVKSTDPSYVGGDIWGSVDNIGKLSPEATEEEKTAYNIKLETERAKVDRIAFSGQTPCNVTGATVGDYIVPIELENGKIGGQAVSNPTLEQYRISVGKVWKIMEDGRAWIAVKIG